MGLGTGEILLIVLVILVVFGASRVPQLGEGLGRAIKNFKRAVQSPNEIEVLPKTPESDCSSRNGQAAATARQSKSS